MVLKYSKAIPETFDKTAYEAIEWVELGNIKGRATDKKAKTDGIDMNDKKTEFATNYGAGICEALGLDKDRTTSVSIHFEPDNFVYAIVKKILTDEEVESVVELAGKANREG